MSDVSSSYPHGHDNTTIRHQLVRTAKQHAAHVLPHLRHNSRVLDCGCGPGTITADIAEICYNGEVVGMDGSSHIIKEAKKKYTDVQFLVGDIHSIPFPDGYFDVVMAHQVLQYVKDVPRVLQEMKRVCKSGGIVAAREADRASAVFEPSNKALQQWTTIMHDYCLVTGGTPLAGRCLKRFAHQVGFSEVRVTASLWTFSEDSERILWGSMWVDRLEKSPLRDTIVKENLANNAELTDMVTALRNWILNKAGWSSISNGEIVCVV